MIVRLATAATLLVAGLAASASSPAAASACTAEAPTVQQVVDGASVIVRGRVVREVDVDADAWPDRFTVAVDRVLRGQAGRRIVVHQPAYLCGDQLAPGSVGTELIVGLDVRFYSRVLSPYWQINGDGDLWGFAEVPEGVTTLDALADYIAAMPDTAQAWASKGRAVVAPLVLLSIALLALAHFLAKPIAKRRAD
jgi:hypothetical protein